MDERNNFEGMNGAPQNDVPNTPTAPSTQNVPEGENVQSAEYRWNQTVANGFAQNQQSEAPAPVYRPAPQPQPQVQPQPPVQPQAQPQVQYVPQPQVQPQPPRYGEPGFAHTGEYRYTPPFATTAERVQPDMQRAPYAPQTAYAAPEKPKKEKKKKDKRTFSGGAVALLLVACILLSFAAGVGGAYLIDRVKSDGSVIADATSDDPMVLYRPAKVEDENGNDVSGTPAGSVSEVCDMVSDSVVEVTTEFNVTYGYYQWVDKGAGSGVIVSDNGYIITNNHVIVDTEKTGKVADDITVRLHDSKEYKAKLIGTDSDSDIAVLKIDAEGLTPAIIGDSSKLKVGEQVVAVGNPLGSLGGTVTTGIVSATNREISVASNKMNLIQIDAAVNPGNSGGGMFNMNGELVGIVNAKYSNTGIEGLGFAIPVNDAVDVATALRENGYVTGRTYIGINYYEASDLFSSSYYFNSNQPGVYISNVIEGYNDDVLKYGDRITALDGDEIRTAADIKAILKKHKVGDVLKMTVVRDGKVIDVDVKCFEYVPETAEKDNGFKK